MGSIRSDMRNIAMIKNGKKNVSLPNVTVLILRFDISQTQLEIHTIGLISLPKALRAGNTTLTHTESKTVLQHGFVSMAT